MQGPTKSGGRLPPVIDKDWTPVNDLQRLIADYLRDNPGESYATIGRRGGIPRGTVWALAKRSDSRQTPRPDTITALAKGLGVAESVVRRAAAQAAGYPTTSPVMTEKRSERIRLMVEAFEELDDEKMDVLERRLRHLVAEAREERAREGD